MDLGISGRKAIVCASSSGLGKACAHALAEAGCEVIVNGLDAKRLEATAAEIAKATGAKVTAVAADVASADGQKALLAACPAPDILINNNAGPPFRDFRDLTRQQMIDGVIANMIVAIELIQKTIGAMSERKFGRIVNITSGSVKMPLAGLDLSSGARAGLTAFLAGVARTVADKNVTINGILPGSFDTDRLRANLKVNAQKMGKSEDEAAKARMATIPGAPLRAAGRIRCGLRVFVFGAGRLHHRPEFADRRRRLQRRVLAGKNHRPSRGARGQALFAGAKLDAQSRRGAPDHAARLLDVIALDHQHEVVWNADLARHFQARAGGGNVAHTAVEAASAVERDGARLEGAVARTPASVCFVSLFFASFFHGPLRPHRQTA